ncbi:protein O-mannose kinase isoform X4 [Balaenoptera musculus]|uniref:Protein O-mannose kinase isoform X4 n=1 Tax=Balaenoptera musculus TaxID=9771 RepID=A0A8B8WEA9_BALMU|nr:protein O-mannose kinase isoform X4 [Balaenoptera musculus]
MVQVLSAPAPAPGCASGLNTSPPSRAGREAAATGASPVRRGCFRVRSDSGFAFRRPTSGCAAAGGRHQGAPSRWSCWARFRPRRRRRLRARPGTGTAGARRSHGDEAPGGQEGAPAQGRAPGGGTAAVHGPHERPPLPLPRPALHLAPALHGGPHALSPRPLQDGADEQLLPVAVLRAAEDRSEADEACRGRSREEMKKRKPEGHSLRGATWCSGVLTWILFSLLQPSAFPLGTRAEDQWCFCLSGRNARWLCRGSPGWRLPEQPGGDAEPLQVPEHEHVAAQAAAGPGLRGHHRLPAPQPPGHAGHVRLQRPAQDAVPVPADRQLQHRAQRPGRPAPGEPQHRGPGEVRPPGASWGLRGARAAVALWRGRAFSRRPHARV